MRLKPRYDFFPLFNSREACPLRIVADAAIATVTVGEGRLVPLVILDTTERSDVEELIRVHQYLAPGDVACQWGSLDKFKDKVALLLTFKKPAELVIIVEFDIPKQGILVDQAVSAKGIYLQAGREGDRFINNPDAPKILLEIPDTGFRGIWNEIFYKCMVTKMRDRGLGRRQAKVAASDVIEKMREFGKFRMGHSDR
ncbi:hypothetical protein [Geomonas anaerohicana]|uniref:Uncharacterized protein n=1 Tax=Geomonas anaerohicana TaxID=2798583 RepID=A0ABS0YF76_9BACT|nr:hypothetical protein [Geomonas anaerohicana]MBJ6750975.1 hypothetical protein [Geomonas anaerohicana]